MLGAVVASDVEVLLSAAGASSEAFEVALAGGNEAQGRGFVAKSVLDELREVKARDQFSHEHKRLKKFSGETDPYNLI